LNGYDYWVKHFEAGSEYGIDGGRISKLTIRKDGKEIYNYDRDLDFDNLDPAGRAVYNELLKRYN
jgi:hypothetical protein